MFKTPVANPSFPKLEDELLTFWRENKTFQKSIDLRPADKTWTFVDGPPFITGLPHYGSLLVTIPKDVFPRFWTMKGYRVRRVWGWDCHGLPAENKVEMKLGIKRKKDIEEVVGIKKFIDECLLYVSEVSGEWAWYIDHVGRWVDFEHAYKTMDTPYMESVMWVFKQMYEKKLIYKGLRISLYCPHCSTPISNFEVAMDQDNYKEITETGDTYKYQLKGKKDTYFLAWSTTPWNKLVTPALAVNPKLTYVTVQEGSEKYILAQTTLHMLKTSDYKIINEMKGSDLVGLEFVPHYDFYTIDPGKKAFQIFGAEFVTADEGTGIVTIAAYGEEDLNLMKHENIQIVMHVDDEGTIKKDVPKFGGMYYLKANKAVNDDLASRGLLYKDEPYTHKVATCWRCHTRLFYAPQDAWYVDIQGMKGQLKETNKEINWFPDHFKHGRFLKSLEAAPDWCISRSRYWGSPVPVWECECGERYVPGSIKELEEKSGRKISDLHKPEIDEVTVKCEKCGETARRVPEVLDSWIEAGSAPYAELHYPMEHTVEFKKNFPPDFIVEYTGQIRAWFYVLHVIGNALFNTVAFKNVAVTGVILGTDGRKMSKNLGNYPDPKGLIEKYGGDALRLYLLGSPVMHGEDIMISEEEYKNQIRNFLLPLWNVYNFFVMYANVNKWQKKEFKQLNYSDLHILDKWILSLLNNLNKNLTQSLEEYDTVVAVSLLIQFVDDLSKWYIRRSRDRIEDGFYATLYYVLTTFTKLSAPIAPFISEHIYQNLTEEESVHLTDWPEVDIEKIDNELESEMKIAREVVEQGHMIRKSQNIKVRIPMRTIEIPYESTVSIRPEILDVVLSELNAKNIVIKDLKYPNPPVEITDEELQEEADARDIIRQIQAERKNMGLKPDQYVDIELPDFPERFADAIKQKVLAKTLQKGDKLSVKP